MSLTKRSLHGLDTCGSQCRTCASPRKWIEDSGSWANGTSVPGPERVLDSCAVTHEGQSGACCSGADALPAGVCSGMTALILQACSSEERLPRLA